VHFKIYLPFIYFLQLLKIGFWLLLVIVSIILMLNKSQYPHGHDPLNIQQFTKLFPQFLAQV